MPASYRYTHRQPTSLASGRPLALADVVTDDDLTRDEEGNVVPDDQWLLDDRRLVPVEESETYPDAPEELTGEALEARAKELKIEGRSQMSADELRAAVAEKESNE